MRAHGHFSLVLACLLVLAVGCEDAAGPASSFAAADEGLVYGNDDRQEYYQISDGLRLGLADSTVALMSRGDIYTSAGGYGIDVSQSFASAYRLCSWEPYRDQPTTAFCSGFQVGPDLVATAGHCVDAASCSDTAFVFGFRMDGAGAVRSWVPSDDVYFCAQVVARVETNTNDYAVVRVDRAIAGHQPLAIRRSGTVSLGTSLVVAGHPAGIPFKVAGGATVRENGHPDYFQSNLDTYGGNSGSPVMNASTGAIEGVLVRGNTDFVYNKKRRCYESNVCNDSGCPGWEEVTRTTKFASYVPDVPSCTSDAECADGDACNGAEACVSGHCQPGAAVDCGDGDACTTDTCVATGGDTWTCDYASLTCDDGDACTIDSCDPASGCDFAPVVCGAGEICDGGLCIAAPVCAAAREACSSNADCCSGSCHPKKHTCR